MMKTTIKLLALAFVLFATACNNNDEYDMLNSLWRNVTQNEASIDDLEKWCAQANTNITSLQTIVNVLESNGMVTSITPVMEGGVEIGYTITFSNHDPITIYHGKDGKDGQNGANGQDGTSPIVGVAKYTDGVYYWTLNGEWLLDENGNKLRVSGQDGADGADGQNGTNGTNGQNGITPQLKIEADYWYVSYDNGSTWTEFGKATGEDGKDGQNGADGKDGQDGDSMFQSVTHDENFVYFTLADGTVIKIGKSNSCVLNDSTTHQGYKFVDLGLSVKWATTNVGAKLTGDLGTLYTCPNSLAGGEDFAAQERGGSWRTPTTNELQELIDNCSIDLKQCVNSDGEIVYGLNFKGKNGKSIILPFKGYTNDFDINGSADGGYFIYTEYTSYWASNINMSDTETEGRALDIQAYIYFRSGGNYPGFEFEHQKRIINKVITELGPIRPVCE